MSLSGLMRKRRDSICPASLAGTASWTRGCFSRVEKPPDTQAVGKGVCDFPLSIELAGSPTSGHQVITILENDRHRAMAYPKIKETLFPIGLVAKARFSGMLTPP